MTFELLAEHTPVIQLIAGTRFRSAQCPQCPGADVLAGETGTVPVVPEIWDANAHLTDGRDGGPSGRSPWRVRLKYEGLEARRPRKGGTECSQQRDGPELRL